MFNLFLSKLRDFKDKRNDYSKQAQLEERLATIQSHEMKIGKCNFFFANQTFLPETFRLKKLSFVCSRPFFPKKNHISASVCEITFR